MTASPQPHPPSSPTPLRLPLTPGPNGTPPTPIPGIDAALIAAVVDEFYKACRADPELGPIFNAHVHDWDEHLARIRAFWSSVLLRTGEYSGRPLQSHLAIPNLTTRHFSAWLKLFHATVTRLAPADPKTQPGTPNAALSPAAAAFMDFAGRMARNIIAVGKTPDE